MGTKHSVFVHYPTECVAAHDRLKGGTLEQSRLLFPFADGNDRSDSTNRPEWSCRQFAAETLSEGASLPNELSTRCPSTDAHAIPLLPRPHSCSQTAVGAICARLSAALSTSGAVCAPE